MKKYRLVKTKFNRAVAGAGVIACTWLGAQTEFLVKRIMSILGGSTTDGTALIGILMYILTMACIVGVAVTLGMWAVQD